MIYGRSTDNYRLEGITQKSNSGPHSVPQEDHLKRDIHDKLVLCSEKTDIRGSKNIKTLYFIMSGFSSPALGVGVRVVGLEEEEEEEEDI